MATKKTTKKSSTGAATAAGAALAAAAAAGVASYYFYGTKNAKKHRHAASSWAKGMKRDVQKGVKSLKKIDSKTVARVVDDAAAAYQGVRGVAAGDVRMAARELKSNWNRIKSEMAPSASVKKAVKAAGSLTRGKKVTKVGKKVAPKKSAPKKSAKKSKKR
ncbi:MAG: hypothetical protein JWO84_96 [Parcubacteria group bacterium]|nr:hypothetical protein [Parcubacteria group bacterium]